MREQIFKNYFLSFLGYQFLKLRLLPQIETDELAADTEADEAATGKREPKPRTRGTFASFNF